MFWFLLDDSIADSFWNAKHKVLILPVNLLKALFKSQQKRKFENSPDRHSWNGKAPIGGRRQAFLEGFRSRKNKTAANLQFIEMPDPLRTWPSPS
jgi:hypothetical protein